MTERRPWTPKQRAAARCFLARVQPDNAAAELVQNLEDLMPARWREGFEVLFATLESEDGSVTIEYGDGKVEAYALKPRRKR